ncbi:MAG TPA: OmpA family protein [Leptolyngbyaceae cyanobacterium M33_DOE_097]|uniref:OmpA-like domain-containing protein n=1 Tax=Oscillatoriales cyanobacterium SpSt-418 TaxID=2282169 RepID=A0A7C3PHQ7_9CYAN|nr:OmpA family protein [Leptolyngbyaceae cyanobacterium M33_DOE_097]
MSKQNNLALILSFVITSGLCGAGVWLIGKAVPNLIPGLGKPSQTTNNPNQSQKITVLGDTFSGYSTFRNSAFQAALKQDAIGVQYADEFDQAKRADKLNRGEADVIVTTLDQFLKQKPQGKIVGLIDRTVGADAVVLNTRKYPNLKSLIDLQQLVQQRRNQGEQLGITYAGDTPSEYLALVLETKFEAFKLAGFQIEQVADASEAWKLLQNPNRNIAIAIMWEPYVTQARQQGYTVVLSSADAPGAVVDVIVASNRLIQSNPGAIANFLEAYYRRIDVNVRDASQLQTQIAQDGNLAPQDAAAVIRGIEFFTAAEAKSWLTNGTLDKRIGSTAAVLTLAGKLDQVPANFRDLYTAEFVAKAASNTQTLIDLVRADNPELADRLAGKTKAIAPTNSTKAISVAKAPDIGNLQVRGEIKFGTGSSALTGQSIQTLKQLAQEIAEFNPQTVAVRVIGHTSRTGSAALNQALSQSRAQVVVNYLRQNGVKNAIAAAGMGSSQPLAGVSPNDIRNQRTEIRLVRVR